MIITELWIPGRPVTKGSLTIVNGIPKDTPQSKAWRRIMAGAVRDDLARRQHRLAYGAGGRPHAGPVAVTAAWFLPVPVTQHGAGDLDKLLRNLLDALSAPGERTQDRSLCAGAIVDDNQVQNVDSWKHCDAQTPGVAVQVRALSQAQIDAAQFGARRWRDSLTA
jgi:Holliday junction resolvase RusA-like endonuclease